MITRALHRTVIFLATSFALTSCSIPSGRTVTEDRLNAALNAQQLRINQLLADYLEFPEDWTPTRIIVSPRIENGEDAIQLKEKILVGELEHVFVQEVGAIFETRIDTGAETSSIDARNIQLFERDGQQWVRFDVPLRHDDKETTSVEAKVTRFVRIKQQAGEEAERRPVIRAQLKLGAYVAETDLNLNDRGHLDYPLLLGRRFIKDIAVVDVSQRYVQMDPLNKPKPAG